jgi:hypothetical protein
MEKRKREKKEIFKMFLTKAYGKLGENNEVLALFNISKNDGKALTNMFVDCKELKVIVSYGRTEPHHLVFTFHKEP